MSYVFNQSKHPFGQCQHFSQVKHFEEMWFLVVDISSNIIYMRDFTIINNNNNNNYYYYYWKISFFLLLSFFHLIYLLSIKINSMIL